MPRTVTKPAHGEKCPGNHGELAALDAEVETDQANEKVFAGQSDIGKCAGEAESVNQAKTKNNCITSRFDFLGKNIFHGHKNNGRGDHRFGDGRWQAHHAIKRQAKRDGVRNGEGGNLPEQRAQTRAEQKKSQHEEDMICSFGNDMMEADDYVAAHGDHFVPFSQSLERDGCLAGIVVGGNRLVVTVAIGKFQYLHCISKHVRKTDGKSMRLDRQNAGKCNFTGD
jgi:hypothetical protein